jgi:DNA-binding transcriptional ArsR family regulator
MKNETLKQAAKACRCLQGISHEVRLGVILALKSGEMNVSSLVKELNIPQPTLSQHLSLMRDRDIVLTRRKGNQVFYRVEDQRIFDLLTMVKTVFCKN